MANKSHKCFPSFSSLNSEFSSSLRIIDIFSDCFSFNVCDKKKDIKFRAQELDKLTLKSSSFSLVALIVSDASIKNNITTSITHIHMVDKPLMKTIHHAVNVTSTEAELFAIRCGINQSIHFDNISKIIIITDSIHAAQKIFQTSVTSLIDTITTPLNSGNVQAISSGIFMVKSTKRSSPLILHIMIQSSKC